LSVLHVITPSLITLGIIPQWAVVDANGAQPPWSITGLPSIGNGDGLSVWTGINGNHKSFRVSFYYPPNYACIDLLLKATSCNVGSVGCPIGVMTNGAQTYQLPDPNTGWKIMNVALASTLCNANPALPNPESVEFDYSL
jgi:hypothetical protein